MAIKVSVYDDNASEFERLSYLTRGTGSLFHQYRNGLQPY